MNSVVMAILVVAGVGCACAVILVVAGGFLAVKEDERYLALRGCLPGANCGACGYAGCDGYAKAVKEGQAETNLCTPGGPDVAGALAGVLGVEVQAVAAQVALVACGGRDEKAPRKQVYEGISTCAAAKLVNGGDKVCTYGCLGYGDCAVVCPHDAICVDGGIARVMTDRCVGCGLCTKVCPNGVISMITAAAPVQVRCNSRAMGAVTRAACGVGCIGCKKCERSCPAGAIRVVENLAVVDSSCCTGCGKCVEDCPTGCLHLRS